MANRKRHGKAFGIVVGAVLAAAAIAGFVTAQPSGPVGIPRVQTTARFTGSGLSTNKLELNIAGASCGAGSAVGSINALGSGTCVAVGTGDIDSVAAGTGLTGGGTTGALTIDFGCGTGLSCAADSVSVDPAVVQSRVSSTCAAPDAIRAIAADGTVTCTTGTGDITSVVAGTGLTGGATSGAATLNVDPTVVQSRVSGTCSAPNAIRAVAQDGTVTCTTGTGSVTSIDSGGGLTGGPVTATGTFAVGAGTNITVNADDVQVANAFDQSASGKSATFGDIRGSIITPTLSADQTSWAPTGFASAEVFNTSVTGGVHIIRGLQGGSDGRRITIRNACQSVNCNILVTSEDALATTASERFFVGNNSDSASLTIYARDSIDFIYTESRWNIVRPGSFDYATFGNGVSFAGAGNFSGGLVTAAGLTADGTITLNNGAGSTRLGNFKATRFAFTITGDQDDYAPTSNALASVLEITPSGATRTITGLVNGADSRIVIIRNPLGAAQDLVLANDRTSTAANRFLFGADLTLHPGDSAALFYALIDSRWVLANNMATNVGTKNVGTITLSTGTGTATVRSGAKCVCSDSTANASVQCAVSTTTLTATGTGSDVIVYHCF